MGEFNEIGEKGRRLYWPTVYLLLDGRVLVSCFPGTAPAGGSGGADDSQRDASGAEERSEQQSKQQRKKEETAMKRLLTLLLPLALVPAWAGGFFDDFDGEDLGSHWEFGNPKGGMIYSVHDSLLEVHSLVGAFPQEWISARVPEFDDFDLRALVGWTDDPAFQRMIVSIDIGFAREVPVAWMDYRHRRDGGKSTNRLLAAFRDGPTREIEAPADGFHQFRMTRVGDELSAYLDETLILRGTGSTIRPRFVTLFFAGDRDVDVDLFVDRVSVVPEPASMVAVAAGIGSLLLRSRRRTR